MATERYNEDFTSMATWSVNPGDSHHGFHNISHVNSIIKERHGQIHELSFSNSSHGSNVTESPTHTHWSVLEKAIFGTWLSMSMILAILGNLMVIAVVWRHRGMRTRTNMFLVNLAVADFLIGILMAPFSLTTLLAHDWILGDALCFVNSFLNAACFITSIQTLMFISIHKYLSITRPLTRITKCKIMIMIIASWSWGILCAALTTFILSKATYKRGTMQCGPKYPEISTKSLLFHFIIQTSDIFLPMIIMFSAYIRMFREIKQHMQRLDENTQMDRQQIYGQQRRVTVTLCIVLACFVLCWLPYCVYANYVTFVEKKDEIPRYANAIAYCFGYMNSACNPIIYAWRSPSFREGYKEILCQEPSYVVSDDKFDVLYNQRVRFLRLQDTIHDSSPSPRRRFSAFITSLRGSRASSRYGSEDSVTGHHKTRTSLNSQSSNNSAHRLLRKLTSRTSTIGTSIIRQEGTVITVKNGKIISMRQENSLRRKHSDFFDDVFLPSPNETTKYNSLPTRSRPMYPNLNVVYETKSDSLEMEPLLQNGDAHKNTPVQKPTETDSYQQKSESENFTSKNSTYCEKSETETNSKLRQDGVRNSSKPRILIRQNGKCYSSTSEDFQNSNTIHDDSYIFQSDENIQNKKGLSKSVQNVFQVPILSSNPTDGNTLTVNNTIIKSSSDTDIESNGANSHVSYRRRWKTNKNDSFDGGTDQTQKISNTKL